MKYCTLIPIACVAAYLLVSQPVFIRIENKDSKSRVTRHYDSRGKLIVDSESTAQTAPNAPQPPRPPKLESPELSDPLSTETELPVVGVIPVEQESVKNSSQSASTSIGTSSVRSENASESLRSSPAESNGNGTDSGSTSNSTKDIATEESDAHRKVSSDLAATSSSLSTPSNTAEKTITADAPLLGQHVPEWVKNGLGKESVKGEEHRFSIGTVQSFDFEQCKEEFETQLLPEVQQYLNENILKHVRAEELSKLTKEYIVKKLLVADKEFDNIVDRPSGPQHQLWRQIYISKESLEEILHWERSISIRSRTEELGIISGAIIAGMLALSGSVGFFAKREKVKIKG